MAEETLEQRVDANALHEKKGEKEQGVLESVINETFDAVKAGVNLGIAGVAPAAAFALTGNAGVFATSAAYVAATKGKKDSKTIRNESLSGATFGAFVHYTTLPLKWLSNIGKIVGCDTPSIDNSKSRGRFHLISVPHHFSKGEMRLFRVHMGDAGRPVVFCGPCGDDALDSGVFVAGSETREVNA